MNKTSNPHLAADVIRRRAANFTPKIGMVLGYGVGNLVEDLVDPIVIPYNELPGFPQLSVAGHSGKLCLGTLNGAKVACLLGRSHSYENPNYDAVKTYVRTLKLLGCEYFIATNASGSLKPSVGPGELMLIQDHINFQPGNPLVGPNDEEFGPRFPAMDHPYDPRLAQLINETASGLNITLHSGVYISVLGPSYETAAEIKAFRTWGADAVGMSTVPEVIVANHCGMRVAVIATITNYATGLATESHTHQEVMNVANRAATRLATLLTHVVGALHD